MRGKLLAQMHSNQNWQTTSMRPAHCAREVLMVLGIVGRGVETSMRPAHCAREVPIHAVMELALLPTSMRPAHCAREVTAGA